MSSNTSSHAIIILSGGMDSGVLLAHSLSIYGKISALTFNYGSKHNPREIPLAQALAQRYRVSHQIIDLRDAMRTFDSSLMASGEAVPDGSYSEVNMKSTVVPFRNGIFLSIAVGVAENYSADTVLIGSHSGDHAVYPDCRPSFTAAFSEAATQGTYAKVKVLSPFNQLSKIEIAEIGRKLNFDFSQTWTCYKGLEFHCGTCGACNERKAALGYSKGMDPTRYIG